MLGQIHHTVICLSGQPSARATFERATKWNYSLIFSLYCQRGKNGIQCCYGLVYRFQSDHYISVLKRIQIQDYHPARPHEAYQPQCIHPLTKWLPIMQLWWRGLYGAPLYGTLCTVGRLSLHTVGDQGHCVEFICMVPSLQLEKVHMESPLPDKRHTPVQKNYLLSSLGMRSVSNRELSKYFSCLTSDSRK